MQQPGTIAWADLTVENAPVLRDFYTEVVGWKCEPLEVGGYSDYVMRSQEDGSAIAGICHAKGVNTGLPPMWLMHVTVEDLDASLAACTKLGGRLLKEPFDMGAFGRIAIIEDPAGASIALLQRAKQ